MLLGFSFKGSGRVLRPPNGHLAAAEGAPRRRAGGGLGGPGGPDGGNGLGAGSGDSIEFMVSAWEKKEILRKIVWDATKIHSPNSVATLKGFLR